MLQRIGVKRTFMLFGIKYKATYTIFLTWKDSCLGEL